MPESTKAAVALAAKLICGIFKYPIEMLAVVIVAVLPVTLKLAVEVNAPVIKLPPVTLAVVVMLAALTRALTTFELKLNPAAFKLPPVMLPVTETVVPVTLPTCVPSILPPEILAVVVMLAALVSADTTFELRLRPAAFKLPPVTLPLALNAPLF